MCCTLAGDQAKRCTDCPMAGASSCLHLSIVPQELPFFAWPVVSFGKVIIFLSFCLCVYLSQITLDIA